MADAPQSWLLQETIRSTAWIRMLGHFVLSFVSAALNYVLRCINGGILNAAFTPIYNETSKEYTYEFDMDQDRLKKYLKGLLMISGKNLPLEVLKTFPVSIGGGEEGVKEAQDNPNREVIFIIGPVAAAILMLIAIIGLIIISFCTFASCCCRSSKGKTRKRDNSKQKSGEEFNKVVKVPDVTEAVKEQEQGKTQQTLPYNKQFNNGYDGYAYYGSDSDSDSDSTMTREDYTSKGFVFPKAAALERLVEERQEMIMTMVEETVERSNFVRKHQNYFCCGCHLFTMFLAIVYVVGLVIFAIFCAVTAQQVAEVMEQPPQDEMSLEEQMLNWLGNKSTHYNLAGTLSFILQQINAILSESSTNLFNTLRGTADYLEGQINITLKVDLKELLTRLEERSGLSEVFIETDYLSSKLSSLLKGVEKIIDDRTSLVPELKSLVSRFKEIHSKLEESCSSSDCKYYEELKVLLIDFDQDKVMRPSDSDGIKGIVETFDKFATGMEKMKKKLDETPDLLIANITNGLNLTEQIDSLQATIDKALDTLRPQVEGLAEQVPQYVDKARPYVNSILYISAVVMAIAAVIFFACLILFIAEAVHRRLFSPTGKAPSELTEVFDSKRGSHICGGCRFFICSILFILLIVLSLLAAAILVVGSILAVEVCPYVHMEKGMKQSDYVLNSIIADKWSTMQQQQKDKFLELQPPKNIIYGLRVVCAASDKNDPKLLPSVGINRLMDLEKLLNDEEFQENISALIDDFTTEISNAASDELLNDVEEMGKMADALAALLDSIHAEAAISELAKLTGNVVEDLDKLLVDLNINEVDPKILAELKEAIDRLKGHQGDIKGLQEDYYGVIANYELPNYLRVYISITKEALMNLKDKAQLQPEVEEEVTGLLESVFETVTNAVNGLVTEILPCGDMHNVIEALVASNCASSGLVNRFFGWALVLTLTILFGFLSFVGIFNLWCVQSHQIKRFYGP